MISAFYFFIFFASVFMTVCFLLRNKKIDSLYIVFCLLVIINSLGRYLLSVSTTLKMALVSNLLIYIGGCYCPFMLLVALRQLCNMHIYEKVLRFMFCFSSVVMCFVLTIGKSGLYYKEVTLEYANGYHYLSKTYGPLHNFYYVLLLAYGILLIFHLCYAVKNRSRISLHTVSIISVLGIFVVGTYLLERILKASISYLSVGYLLAVIILVYLLERIKLYDLTFNIANSVELLHEYAYIEFDRRYHYITANAYAKELFPEIENQWKIDADIPVSDSYLYREVISYLTAGVYKDDKFIEQNDHYFQINIRNIYKSQNRIAGYLLELIDRTGEKRYLNTLESYNVTLEKEVADKTANISYIKDMMVLGMASLVESRDNSTGGHIRRTSEVVKIFADKLLVSPEVTGLSRDFLQMVVKAAPMHDLGKIAVPDRILQKQGRFTEEEYELMKNHSAEGAKVLKNILTDVESEEFVRIATNVAHYHHEKWNGQGYPEGLSGEEIPVEARIMALADVFDALVSKRCYKEAYSYDVAFGIIAESLGSHFDPVLGKVFLSCRPQLEAYYDANVSL